MVPNKHIELPIWFLTAVLFFFSKYQIQIVQYSMHSRLHLKTLFPMRTVKFGIGCNLSCILRCSNRASWKNYVEVAWSQRTNFEINSQWSIWHQPEQLHVNEGYVNGISCRLKKKIFVHWLCYLIRTSTVIIPNRVVSLLMIAATNNILINIVFLTMLLLTLECPYFHRINTLSLISACLYFEYGIVWMDWFNSTVYFRSMFI